MTTKVLESVADLDPYYEAWNQLVVNSPKPSPMISPAWVMTFYEYCLGPGDEIACLMALDNDELVGVLPLIRTPVRGFGRNRFMFRTPTDLHTPSVDSVAKVGLEQKVVEAFLSHLCQSEHSCDVIKFSRIPEFSPSIESASAILPGYRVLLEYDGLGTFVDTRIGFEKYQANLASKFKSNLRRVERLMALKGDVTFRNVTSRDYRQQDLEEFIRIEGSGWKGNAGSSIGSSKRLRDFYTALANRLASADMLELHFLDLNGKPIAGEFVPKVGRRHVALKIGYDPAHANASPGKILISHFIEEAMVGEKVDQIDWVSDSPWHYEWCLPKIKYYNILFYPKRPVSYFTGYVPKRTQIALRKVPAIMAIYRKIRGLAASV